MIDKPELPGSGSPTTPALIEFLERWAEDFPQAHELRAAADALRSLQSVTLERDTHEEVMHGLADKLSAAEAEVARLTSQLEEARKERNADIRNQ